MKYWIQCLALELAQDFHDAIAVMLSEYPKHRMLELLKKVIGGDIQFIACHQCPMTLYQKSRSIRAYLLQGSTVLMSLMRVV